MKINDNDILALEVLSPKGKFNLEATPESPIGELHTRVAQLLQADPSRVSLIAGGKFVPAEGSLGDFLQGCRGGDDGGACRRIYAVCDRPPEPTPLAPKQASSPTQTTALDLMPDHIREELASGGKRFADLVSSWESRMRDDPVATSRHLRSPETRDLLESLRAPRMQPGSVPSIGTIDIDAFITPPQRFLQEAMDRQKDQAALADASRHSGPQGIQKDIRFYHQMVEDSLKPLTQPPTLPSPPPPSSLPPTTSQSVEPSSAASLRHLKADSVEMDALLQRTDNTRAVEAFKGARESLRLLQDEAPELLRALVGVESGRPPPLAAATGRAENPALRASALLSPTSGTPADGAASLMGVLQSLANFREALGGLGGLGDLGGLGGLGDLSGLGDLAEANSESDLPHKYSVQMQHLAEMGFTDKEANVRALQATRGDLHAAIDRLEKEGGD